MSPPDATPETMKIDNTTTTKKPTPTPSPPNLTDSTLTHTWFFEPPPTTPHSVITPAGLENIAHHKYVPGQYTHLDNFLNPFWTYLTNLLPLSLAPNMVTTLGGLHCGFAYALMWYYSPNLDEAMPDWVILISGYTTLAYYTLDCMDGKQARRTGTSSPLGQLFDHGFDCICTLAHCANTGGYLMVGGSPWFMFMQMSLQLAFFCAQWEEYYTHVLPHACGEWVGVTETNYGIGMLSIINAFIDREAFWTAKVSLPFLPSDHWISSVERRHAILSAWLLMILILILLSIRRVFNHVTSNTVRLSALSKFVGPLIITISPFLLPTSLLITNTRYISLATGLLFSLLTKKMIVFSMAKMSYATFQFDVAPLLFLCLWIRFKGEEGMDVATVRVLLSLCTLFNAHRLVTWCRFAILQITKRLDIYCFTIKKKKEV